MAEAPTRNLASEFRALRPYKGVDQVQAVLEDATLRIGDDIRVLADGNQVLEANTYLTAMLELDLLRRPEDPDGPAEEPDGYFDRLHKELREAGIESTELNQLRFMVVATTPYLKLIHVLWVGGYSDLVTSQGRLPLASGGRENRPRPLLAPSGGCTIEFIAYLGEDRGHDRSTRPLEVHSKGTWLARIRFDLETDITEIGFTPTPLTEELKEDLLLPEETIRYIIVEDPLAPDGSSNDLTVYVDADVLNAIAANAGGTGARTFQLQLAIDVIAAIVNESSILLATDPDATFSSIQGSLCHRLLRQASRTNAGRIDEEREEAMFTQVKDEPLRVIASFEGSKDVIRKRLLSNIKETG